MTKVNGLVSLFRAIKPTNSERLCKTTPKPTSDITSHCGSSGSSKRIPVDPISDQDGSSFWEQVSNTPSRSNVLLQCNDLRQKKMTRERHKQWFTRRKNDNIDYVIMKSSRVLGCKTLQVLEKLGRVTGEKEYNSLIKLCLDEALGSDDNILVSECISNALRYIEGMKGKGFSLKEETYGPVLLCMIDKGMIKEFQMLARVIEEEGLSSTHKLGYYNLLLYLRLNEEIKVKELCQLLNKNESIPTRIREQYLLAICEYDRRDLICQLLENFDMSQVSSVDDLLRIFQSLGRLQLEPLAEKFLPNIKESCYGPNLSTVLCAYVTNITNLCVEDVVSRFDDLHRVLNVEPSFDSYEMIVIHCCKLLKVHLALDIVERMYEVGFCLSLSMVHHLCDACDESFEFSLVRRIYSLVWHQGLKPDTLTFRSLIRLLVKMNDFDGAFSMLQDMKKLNLKPVAGIYNIILGGYYRVKYIDRVVKVLKQMEDDGVEPDSSTYSYLIGNSDREEEILELYERMKNSGVRQLKQVFVALINAYTSCGQYDKAKQVVLDQNIPINDLSEIKSKLVLALSLHGQFLDALVIYKEMKKTGCALDAKAVIGLIDNFQTTENSLRELLELLDELHDHDLWVEGCYRSILFCVRQKQLSSVVHLIKQLYDRSCRDELTLEYIFDRVFAEVASFDPIDVNFGLDLLRIIKIEFGLLPSRKSLDFMLNACIKAKDLQSSLLIWKTYQLAGLPYNVISYLRMYHALLASQSTKQATVLLSKMPRNDFHVSFLIQSYNNHYTQSSASDNYDQKLGAMTRSNSCIEQPERLLKVLLPLTNASPSNFHLMGSSSVEPLWSSLLQQLAQEDNQ